MILIVVKWKIRPEKVDGWLAEIDPFTQAVRAEEGNLFFEWSRSVDEPDTFVLVEGFRDAAAGEAHVATDHFQKVLEWTPDWVAERPQIIHVNSAEATGWGEMGEVSPR